MAGEFDTTQTGLALIRASVISARASTDEYETTIADFESVYSVTLTEERVMLARVRADLGSANVDMAALSALLELRESTTGVVTMNALSVRPGVPSPAVTAPNSSQIAAMRTLASGVAVAQPTVLSESSGTLLDAALNPVNGAQYNLSGSVAATLTVTTAKVIDHVEWLIDGVTFREDDLALPYNLDYNNAPVPFGADFNGRGVHAATVFNMSVGSHAIVARVHHTDLSTFDTPAVFDVVTAPPPSGDDPWTLPAGAVVQVTLPQGTLGPTTATGTDPVAAGVATLSGGLYTVTADWDETAQGAYLDFGTAAVNINGHIVKGFIINADVTQGVQNNVYDSTRGDGFAENFIVTNTGNRTTGNAVRCDARNFQILNCSGDGLKAGDDGENYTWEDGYVELKAQSGSAAHYDGLQAFRDSVCVTRRIVFDMQDGGTVAGMNAAVYTSDQSGGTYEDILILGVAGCWFPVRFHGSTTHTWTRIQAIGVRGQPFDNSSLAPSAIMRRSSNIPTPGPGNILVNDVPGAADWTT